MSHFIPPPLRKRILQLQKASKMLSLHTADYKKKEEAAKLAKEQLDKVKVRFNGLQDDLIGDFFNGCFNGETINIIPSNF